jgi:hypothetical protein
MFDFPARSLTLLGEHVQPLVPLRFLDVAAEVNVLDVFDVRDGKNHVPVYHGNLASRPAFLPSSRMSGIAIVRVMETKLEIAAFAEPAEIMNKRNIFIL